MPRNVWSLMPRGRIYEPVVVKLSELHFACAKQDVRSWSLVYQHAVGCLIGVPMNSSAGRAPRAVHRHNQQKPVAFRDSVISETSAIRPLAKLVTKFLHSRSTENVGIIVGNNLVQHDVRSASALELSRLFILAQAHSCAYGCHSD